MSSARQAAEKLVKKCDGTPNSAVFTGGRQMLIEHIATAILAEREACAKEAESHAINARRIADKWTPGAISADGNVRTVAYWSTHEKAATDISAAIRARQP
jgi:hypothetical protein